MSPRTVALVLGAIGVLALEVASAAAQTTSEPVGRLQVAVGAGWLGGASLGEQPADLRSASATPFQLFDTDSDLGAAGTFEARVGFALTPHFGIEGRAAISRPELSTVITNDVEAPGTFTAVERVDQYVFDGGIVVRFGAWDGVGLTPFATAGLGYVRQLHEEHELVEDGHLFYVGGGVTHTVFSRPQGLIRAASVRADVRLNVFSVELDESNRPQGSVTGSLVLAF